MQYSVYPALLSSPLLCCCLCLPAPLTPIELQLLPELRRPPAEVQSVEEVLAGCGMEAPTTVDYLHENSEALID